jgi:hypothetical protein
MTALSLRRLWTIYKKILTDDGMGRRDLILAQQAFYSGARGVLKVLGRLAERGEYDALHKTIARQKIKALQGLRPRARWH